MENSRQSPDLYFKELETGFSLREAFQEAKRCLNCMNPLCRTGCPINNNIPAFIQALARGDIEEQMNYSLDAPIFQQSADASVLVSFSVKPNVSSPLKSKESQNRKTRALSYDFVAEMGIRIS